ncbi:hypothetical protein NHQ30_011375 [Ciborinia camelliae]|nr:hypothetical protein NHQ30_011375 [Ciborinia camelliae]
MLAALTKHFYTLHHGYIVRTWHDTNFDILLACNVMKDAVAYVLSLSRFPVQNVTLCALKSFLGVVRWFCYQQLKDDDIADLFLIRTFDDVILPFYRKEILGKDGIHEQEYWEKMWTEGYPYFNEYSDITPESREPENEAHQGQYVHDLAGDEILRDNASVTTACRSPSPFLFDSIPGPTTHSSFTMSHTEDRDHLRTICPSDEEVPPKNQDGLNTRSKICQTRNVVKANKYTGRLNNTLSRITRTRPTRRPTRRSSRIANRPTVQYALYFGKGGK